MSVLRHAPCPPSLKSIQHYLKTALEHESRDPVITYWCRLYSLQTALKIDKKSDEAKTLLMTLIEWLEKQKKVLSDNEAVTNDIAAQAHVENYALKLFMWADGQDRAGVFNKNVVKAFYTAGMLMDVLSIFGELGEEIIGNRKYAKWKAAYIHNSLRNGQIPNPGPIGWDGGEEEDNDGGNDDNTYYQGGQTGSPSNIGFNIPGPSANQSNLEWRPDPDVASNNISDAPPAQPSLPSPLSSVPENIPHTPSGSQDFNITGGINNIKLGPDQINKAQKYCKFAASALNYDDVPEAINNLQKALKLLQTGHDN